MSVVAPFGRMFTSHEAAEFLGMPMRRLRRLVAAKKIPVVRDGRLAFLEADLRDWIETHRTPAVDERKSKHLALPKPIAEAGSIEDLMPRKLRLSKAS